MEKEMEQFINSIYLGDCFCTKLVFEGVKNQVELHVNLISRIRSESGDWNFYSDEDIENGAIVFTGIQSISLGGLALLPNDQIYDIHINKKDIRFSEFIIEMSHVDQDAITHDMTMSFVAEGAYLMNPLMPGVEIFD